MAGRTAIINSQTNERIDCDEEKVYEVVAVNKNKKCRDVIKDILQEYLNFKLKKKDDNVYYCGYDYIVEICIAYPEFVFVHQEYNCWFDELIVNDEDKELVKNNILIPVNKVSFLRNFVSLPVELQEMYYRAFPDSFGAF